jgi:bacillithiol biosynthesis cysteine-adding enzyme BshC
MASEDHDFAEINHIHLFGEKIEWNGADAKNFGGPSGKLGTQGISAVIEKVKKKIEREPGSVKVIDLLQKAYLNHDNLADATRYLVNELFGKYGLVVMDANEKNFKQYFSEVMTNDLIHHSAFKLVNETSKQLEVRYEVQVHPREINLFYMTGGSRKRITNDGEKYLQEMETSPENFSPNVVLRPLYQEMLLPNIAMVGGPAEIAYWLQYKKMFEHYGVNFPMLVPRKSCLWIDEKSSEAMRKLKIKTEELFDSADELISRYLADITMHRNSLEKEEQKIFDAFDELARKISETDPTLQATVEAERDKLLDAIERVEAKFIKADKIKHDTAIQKIKKLKEKLFPEGTLQERYENFIPYYLKYGDGFFEMLLANGEVFDFKLNVLAEDNRQ